MESLLYPVLGCIFASFLLAQGLVATARLHGRFTMDRPGAVQTFHDVPTPRIGGVGIYTGLLACRAWLPHGEVSRIVDTVLMAGIPALGIGLLEDVTRRVSPSVRLAVTMTSGALACWISGQAVTAVGLPFIDPVLHLPGAAFLFTAFAVGGLANAINIIDGFHGLASGTTTIALLAIGAIAWHTGDTALALAALLFTAAICGFWLVNFPWGRLFLGDGGAYFAGAALAWLAVLLPLRNPQVSPWASLLVCGYPVLEVLYSIWRRLRGHVSPGQPDRQHLHSLVAARVVMPRLAGWQPRLQNAAVSVCMWVCAAIPAMAAVVLYGRTAWLMAVAAACVLLYHWLYRWVARQ